MVVFLCPQKLDVDDPEAPIEETSFLKRFNSTCHQIYLYLWKKIVYI